MSYEVRTIWIKLGGVRLRLPVYLLVGDWRNPKVVSLAKPRTIPRSARFHGKDAPYPLSPGWIFGWRDGENGKVWYHIRSLYEAVRSFQHALDSEGRAHQDARICIQAAIELVKDLLAYWPLEPEKYEALNDKLMELYGQLENANDPFLKDAADYIFAVSGFGDDSGILRLHPSTIRIYAARRLVTVRLSDILRIAPRLSHIQVQLTEELSTERYILLEHCLALLLEARKESNPRAIARKLQTARDDMAAVRAAPFRGSAWKIGVAINQALDILHPYKREDKMRPMDDRVSDIRPLLNSMVREIALRRAQDALEMHIIRPVSCSALSLEDMRGLAIRVDRFRTKAQRLSVDRDTRIGLSALLMAASGHLVEGHADKAKEMLKDASGMF